MTLHGHGVRRALLAIAILAATAWGQKPGAVEGVVRNAATGAPVRKALVVLRDVYAPQAYQVVSDNEGRFRIDNVKPGEYGLWADAQGYAREAGRFFAPSQTVTVAEEKTIRDFAIRLQPLGAISGRVVDENGEPVPGATVDGLRYSYSAQGPHLGQWASATTNDRGEYRVFDLEPGNWYLRVFKSLSYPKASGRVHRAMADAEYTTTYYAGAARAEDASPTAVAPGADVTDVEIRIRKTRVFRVQGKVMNGSGAAVAQARVRIEGEGYVESRADGTFDARAIPRGTHRVQASFALPDRMLESSWQQVTTADRDIEGLVFRLEPVPPLNGTVGAEDGAAGKLAGAQVALEPLGGIGETLRGAIGEDARFAVANAAAQVYRVRVDRLNPALYLKSVRLGDRDASDDGRIEVAGGGVPLTLVVSGDGGRVTGTVQAAAPGPAAIVVTLAPSGRFAARVDLVKTVETDAGRFTLQGVAPGEYKIWAWELADEDLAGYAEFRKLMENKAVSLKVRAGEPQAVELKAITAVEVAEARGKLR
ncbi:MAG TPA: carboxypeptidase regulatory-like domain-containing protein [Candidatus Solibacter sp.]